MTDSGVDNVEYDDDDDDDNEDDDDDDDDADDDDDDDDDENSVTLPMKSVDFALTIWHSEGKFVTQDLEELTSTDVN